MDKLILSHYFHLPSQGNIYTMTNLQLANGFNKILVASLKREIFCIEFQQNSKTPTAVIPTAKEISFTYIPSGAEIISLDAFNKSMTKNEFVIGITIVKNNNNLDSLEFYLNIYSEWEESDEFNIENIAQNCLILELSFTPYHLTHTELVVWKDNDDDKMFKETVFLLSGSDNQIHVYREQTIDHIYKEIDNKEYFPETIKTPTPVVWIDIYNNKDYAERYMAIVCECGYVRLTKVCTKTNKLLFNFTTKLSNCLSNVQIFDSYNPEFTLNLLVVGTILPPVLFEDITTYGLSKYTSLPRHDYTCVLTSSLVVDFDFDGNKEILIGSSAEEVIMYKKDEEKGWCLEQIKLFPSPILKLHFIDIIADGVKELIVLSMKGVHFLQFNFKILDDILRKKLDSFEHNNKKRIDDILFEEGNGEEFTNKISN